MLVKIKSVKISIAPNPARSQLTVNYPYKQKPVSLLILNSSGMQINKLTIKQSQTLVNISRMPAGVYYLVFSGEGRPVMMKFIKQ